MQRNPVSPAEAILDRLIAIFPADPWECPAQASGAALPSWPLAAGA